MQLLHAWCKMVNLNNETENSQETLIVNWRWNGTRRLLIKTLCNDFSTNEVMAAIKTLKAGKAPGTDNLHPEFFLHLDEKCFQWLQILFSNCLSKKKLPKVWKMAKKIAALTPNKPVDNPGWYRPISLLCIPYKLYKRLIYNRIKPVTESVLPEAQAGFRPNSCTLDQVALLNEDIEASFDKKLKAGVVFVDLSAAYDTVWHRVLTLKMLRTIPSREMERVNHAVEPYSMVFHKVL